MPRRKVNNLLGLTVLSLLVERPMHPYEMASTLRERGKDEAMTLKWGSLYTVVANLEKHGFIQATGNTRQGRRPERTVYAITDDGRAELQDWLRELIRVPTREHPKFETALSVIGVVPPEEAMELLRLRLRDLEVEATAQQAALGELTRTLPRLFLIECEYYLALQKAEADWLRGLLEELEDASLDGVKGWRIFHETGHAPEDWSYPERRPTPERKEDAPG